MTKVRSRNRTDGKYLVWTFIKRVVTGAAIAFAILAGLSILGSNAYDKKVEQSLVMVDNIYNSGSYEVRTSDSTIRSTINKQGKPVYMKIETKEGWTQLLMKDDKCYMNIEDFTTKEQRAEFGGKVFVAVSTDELMKGGFYSASDVLGYVNTALYRKELKDSKIVSKAMRYLKYLINGEVEDTYGYLGSKGIYIVDKEKFNSISAIGIDAVGNFSDRLGEISVIFVNESGAEIVGSGEHIKIGALTGKSDYDTLAATIESLSIDLKDTGGRYKDKFFKEYETNNIIESLKGAFKK